MDTDKIRESVAEHLKIVRNLKGMSPEEAADRAQRSSGKKLSGSYIRRLEKAGNSPTVETLAVLCDAYNTTLEQFFASLRIDRRKAS
jgi:transcriptional regulator with XRE-family HTH domain